MCVFVGLDMTGVLSEIWIKDKRASPRKILSDTIFLEGTAVFSKAAS